MKSQNNPLADLLDFDTPEASQDVLWSAGMPNSVHTLDGCTGIELNFFAQTFNQEGIELDKNIPSRRHTLWVRAYGEEIIRLTINFNGSEMPACEFECIESPRPKVSQIRARSIDALRPPQKW